jgi:eukaryotic-like serine/threonine-protein kinase
VSDLDWRRVAEIFSDALDLPPAERGAFIDAQCAGRPDERAAVERMLAAEQEASPRFLGSIDPSLLDEVAAAAAEPVERIGPWRLVHEIGRGGMGQVFLGERGDGQFEQQVAIKLLKRGMDSDAILDRFLRERQILADLDHPNIARLFDGGIAEDGRPYFVMEFVDGEPITEFADARKLTIEARLDLFRSVCLAVEYAHRNLVVHRDLKPSNILVTRDGWPKLLDFGIAKLLTAADGGAHALRTATEDGLRLMTPAYAAPEQFSGGPVTTSTDVYGLGAVLFELLSGRRPFDAQADRFRMPPETEPITLSTVVQRAQSGGPAEAVTADALAAARSTDASRLRRRLAGDLDTIVATALRAAPERRYGSVGALQEDLQRHREQLPVRARPDTVRYRVSRFVRRNRWGVVSAGSIGVLVLAFAITTTAQSRALAFERDRAQREAAAARNVSLFLESVFEPADPMMPGHGDSISATTLLERGAARIENELGGQPDIQARLFSIVGRAFSSLRRADLGVAVLARAVDLQRATSGAESPTIVPAMQELAQAQLNMGDWAAAEATLREAIALHRRVQPVNALLWALQVDLGQVYNATGDSGRAREAAVEAMAIFHQLSPEEAARTRGVLRRMADLSRFNPDAEAAEGVFRRLIEIERAGTGENSVPVAVAYTLWARASSARGDMERADELLRNAEQIHRTIDATSLSTAATTLELSSTSLERGDAVRADSLARIAVHLYRERLGEDDRSVAIARSSLADALHAQRRFDESVTIRRLAVEGLARRPEDAVSLRPTVQARLASTLHEAGRTDEAFVEFEQALRVLQANFPADHVLTADVRHDYGSALVEAGRAADAVPMLRQALEALASQSPEEGDRTDRTRVALGHALTSLGRFDEADSVLRAVLERRLQTHGTDDELATQARAALSLLESLESTRERIP